jgi:hypothetical protein
VAVRGKIIERGPRNEPVRITGAVNEITFPEKRKFKKINNPLLDITPGLHNGNNSWRGELITTS